MTAPDPPLFVPVVPGPTHGPIYGTAPPSIYQAPPAAPPTVPPRRRRTGLRIVAGLLILAVLGVVGVVVATNLTGSGGGGHTIVFEVSGPATADIVYQIGGQQTPRTGQVLPWREQVGSDDAVLIVVVTAQSTGSEDITCRVSIDGVAGVPQTSSGEFAMVTCTNE